MSQSPYTSPETHPDLNYAVGDLRRTMLRVAANLRWYEQSWLGMPIWQLADDIVALQRIVFDAQPRWIVETGTKFGGSALFFASLLSMMGRTEESGGGVITVDVRDSGSTQFVTGKPSSLCVIGAPAFSWRCQVSCHCCCHTRNDRGGCRSGHGFSGRLA